MLTHPFKNTQLVTNMIATRISMTKVTTQRNRFQARSDNHRIVSGSFIYTGRSLRRDWVDSVQSDVLIFVERI